MNLAKARHAAVAAPIEIALFDYARNLRRGKALRVITEDQNHRVMKWLVTFGCVRPAKVCRKHELRVPDFRLELCAPCSTLG